MAKQTGKNKKPFDMVTDLIIIGIVVVVLLIIGNLVWGRIKSREEGIKNRKDVSTQVTAIPTKEGVTTYSCKIAGNDGSDATIFQLSFDSNVMTYTETMQAGTQSSGLSEGTYEQKDGTIKTTSKSGKTIHNYVQDGDYLLDSDEMYQGKMPGDAGDTFDGKFTYKQKDEMKTTVTFAEDGTYKKDILSYGTGNDGDSTVSEGGTYKKDGNLIVLTADSGQPMIPYYIYQDKITNAYYIQDK